MLSGLLATACGEPTVRYVGQPPAGPSTSNAACGPDCQTSATAASRSPRIRPS